MTPSELKAIRERCEKATPPSCGGNCEFTPPTGQHTNGGDNCYRNSSLEERMYVRRLHRLRADIPRLLDEVECLTDMVDSLVKDRQRLKEALRWYAENCPWDDSVGNFSERAREALRGAGMRRINKSPNIWEYDDDCRRFIKLVNKLKLTNRHDGEYTIWTDDGSMGSESGKYVVLDSDGFYLGLNDFALFYELVKQGGGGE